MRLVRLSAIAIALKVSCTLLDHEGGVGCLAASCFAAGKIRHGKFKKKPQRDWAKEKFCC